MNAEGLLHKAGTALSSARLLLQSGDSDGTCNQAYYAMFDAAWAVEQAAAFLASVRTTFFKNEN